MRRYNDPLHVSYEDLTVFYENRGIILNKSLLDKQLCWENLGAIKDIHFFKLMLYQMISETEDPKLLKSLVKDITECEYELQKLWKFSIESRFHRFWETPKCQCPTMDNNDWYPTGHYIINNSCPLHGID